jgi:hypothetical protein
MKYLKALLNRPLPRNESGRPTDKTDRTTGTRVLSVLSGSCPRPLCDEDWDLAEAYAVLHQALWRVETMYVECPDPTLRRRVKALLSAFGREVEDSLYKENLNSLDQVCAEFEAHLAALLELRADP